MKRTILILSVLTLLYSCSNEDNKTLPKEELLSKSIKYLDATLNTDESKGVFSFNSIDTVNVISSVDIEVIKRQPLMNEYKYHKEYYEKFSDIDKQFDSEEGTKTKFHKEKANEIIDSLQRWQLRTEKMDSTDTVGYEVKIAAEGIDTKSGGKIKDLSFPVYFDSEYDVHLQWNELMYGKLKN